MSWRWLPVIVWLVITTLGITLGSLQLIRAESVNYVGKETFETQEEYIAFKRAVSELEVNITRLETLSSNPPIVVGFHVSTKQGYHFPYGEGSRESAWPVLPLLGSFGAFAVAAAIYGWFAPSNEKEGR